MKDLEPPVAAANCDNVIGLGDPPNNCLELPPLSRLERSACVVLLPLASDDLRASTIDEDRRTEMAFGSIGWPIPTRDECLMFRSILIRDAVEVRRVDPPEILDPAEDDGPPVIRLPRAVDSLRTFAATRCALISSRILRMSLLVMGHHLH